MSAMKFLQGPLAFISSHVGHGDEDDRGLKVLPTAETASAKGGFQTGYLVRMYKKLFHGHNRLMSLQPEWLYLI